MIHLSDVLAAAGEVQRFCQDRGWRFCFIGGDEKQMGKGLPWNYSLRRLLYH